MDYKEFVDEELIRQLKLRDRAAFAEIYDRYAIIVFYKINQMLRDEDAAKDLVQDLFTSIWEKSELIRDDANLAGYLYTASRNRTLKLIQKGKVRSDYLTSLGKFTSSASYETLEKLDEKEMMMLITREIEKLPPKMREVFQLSRVQNLSHKEIAVKLNISEATVRKQVQNSLGILKNKLSNYSAYGILLLAILRD